MKLSRVSCKLPAGVVIGSTTLVDFDGWPLWLIPKIATQRIVSDAPLELVLEVPEKQEGAVAGLLRAMANELEGK